MRGSLEFTQQEVQDELRKGCREPDDLDRARERVRNRKMLAVVQHVREGGFTNTSNERIDTLCDVIEALIRKD